MRPDYRARIARLNPAINAIMDDTQDTIGAGLCWVAKSNIAVKDLPLTAGCEAYRSRIASEDAEVIARIRSSGGAVLGTVNMHEGALGATTDNEAYGRTRNPWNLDYTPGGSSGGSGAAVAAGLCDVALGTDTMGSVRIPAAYCGVQGHKPTTGIVSDTGVIPLSTTLDHVGPLARDVETLWRAMNVLAGWGDDAKLEPISLSKLKIGVWTGDGDVTLTPAVQSGFEAAVAQVRNAGAELKSVSPPRYDYSKSRRAGLLISEVEGAKDHLVFVAAGELQHGAVGDHLVMCALDERGMRAPERQHLAVVMQQRGGVLLLDRGGVMQMLGADGQPRAFFGEPAMAVGCFPHHRCAAAVAALELGPELDPVGVLQVFVCDIRLAQAQFLALVHADGAAQRHQERGQRALGRVGQRPAGGVAHHVVVGERPAGPAFGDVVVDVAHHLGEPLRRGGVARQEFKAVAHVHPALARGVLAHDLEPLLRVADLTHRRCGAVLVQHRAEPFEEREVLGLVLGIEVQLVVIGVHAGRDAFVALVHGQGRVGPQFLVVDVDRVEANAVHAPVQPEAGHIQQRVLHVHVVEVQVRLFDEEVVQVILLAPAVPLPRRATKDRQPVVGRRAVLLGVGPDVPVGLGVVATGARFRKPRVHVGGVRQHQVDHYAQAQLVRHVHQRVKVGQRAEHRVDVAIVADVIAEILHRRGEERRDPDRIDAQRGDVGQAAGDAVEITDTVTVAVLKAAGVDLVNHRTAPPVLVSAQHLGHFSTRVCVHERGFLFHRPGQQATDQVFLHGKEDAQRDRNGHERCRREDFPIAAPGA